MGRYSKLPEQGERLQKLLEIHPTGVLVPSVRPPKQLQRRLLPHEINDLIDAYRDGVEVRELAIRFNIHRTTVLAHVARAGVPGRRDKLNGRIDEARLLYEQGWSLKRVGEELGVGASTVYNAFRAAGVRTRPRRGYEHPHA